jgi:hypothetical protein
VAVVRNCCPPSRAEREHELAHELWKRQADEVSHCQLCDRGAAAGITELHARNEVDENGRCVGWKGAIQNLCKGWPRTAGRISRKAMHGRPCSVAQELAEIDPRRPAVIAFGHLPRLEIGFDIRIQVDALVLA